MPAPTTSPRPDRTAVTAAAGALVALFLSGASGLVDEVVWIRRSALVFGSTTHALSTVLAVFLLGLALGGWVFGRLAERLRRPLLACALLEAALAVLVAATPFAFDAVEAIYGRVYRALPPDSAALWGARAGLVALILLPPTILMGGTLPLFGRQLVRDPRRIGAVIARLYALNTLGAAAGCVVAGFVLIPAIGMTVSLWIAAGLNLAAAGLLVRARAEPAPTAASRAAPTPVERRTRWLVGGLLFATGFVALGEEVLWTRFLAPLVGNTVHTVTIMLGLVLLGIVLGSLLAMRVSDRAPARVWLFGACQVASGLVVWLLVKLPPAWWRWLGGELPMAALLLLPPAILSGISFPLAVRMVVSTPAWAGIGIGSMIAVNTLGGIGGAVAVGFFLLPGLGLESSVRICTAASLAAGFAAWMLLDGGATRAVRTARGVAAAASLAAWIAVPVLAPTRLPADFLAERDRLVDYREGFESNLAVVRRSAGGLALEIDRWWQGQDKKSHQVMAAHLPTLLHPAPRRVLVVGVGAGQTPLRFAMHGVERLDCVDIEPRVFELVREHFSSEWMRDPRVRLFTMDGRNHLSHAAERYDLVSLEVGQLFRPGAASFYTRDFYRRARARLAPGGVISQFVPLPYLAPPELRSVLATFLAEFPQATLWYNTSELLLVGSADTAPVLRRERVAQVLSDSTIARDLRWSPWGGPAHWLARPDVLAGSYLCGPGGLAGLSQAGSIYRDDRPALEHAMARVRGEEARERETVPLLRQHLDPVGSGAAGFPEGVLQAAARLRERNLGDVLAAVELRGVEAARDRGDVASAAAALRRALEANPENVLAHRLLGDALLLLRDPRGSERSYREALVISPDDAAARAGLGLLCLAEKRLAESAEHYRVALAAEPDHAEWRNNLGATLGQLGDLAGALEQFERALALRPDDQDTRRNYERTRAAAEARTRSGEAGP